MDYPVSIPWALANTSFREAGGRRRPGRAELSSDVSLSISTIPSPSTSPTLCFCPSPAALSPFAKCGVGSTGLGHSLTRPLTCLLFSSLN